MSAQGMACGAPVLLSIEAIIGAGKSTLLEELAARSDVVVVREPVDLWQQSRGGDTLLNRYYGNQKANAWMFQTFAMLSHVEALRRAKHQVTAATRAIVMERSWLSARHCFMATLKEAGNVDELEDSLHEDLFNWGLEAWPTLDGVVFLDLPTAIAQERVAKRGRMAESSIPSEYQDALSAKHREWLHESGFCRPVLTLDGSGDKGEGAVAKLAARVMDFAQRLWQERQPNLKNQLLNGDASTSEGDASASEEVVTPIKRPEGATKRQRLHAEQPHTAVKA